MLKSIERYRIGQIRLIRTVFFSSLCYVKTLPISSLVPPMIVLLCKVSYLVSNADVQADILTESGSQSTHDLSSVRFVLSGAAPLSSELMEQLVKTLPNVAIGQGYGMTESCAALTFPRLDMKVGMSGTLGNAGVLLPGVTAKVIKDDGTAAGFGEQGELYVTAPSLALGYHENETA